jgi:3-oxoacyl-[acyl-carrier-protein] synthase II
VKKGEERRFAKFTQYAIAATEMALDDAGWKPQTHEDQEMTGVCLGSGIGNLEEHYNTSIAYNQTVSLSQLYLPRILLRCAGRDIRKFHLCSSRSF